MKNFMFSILAALGINSVNAEDFPPNVEANKQTINALIEAGSDPKKLHPLEHHFYAFDQQSLAKLLKRGKELGYRIANTGENVHEGEQYWYGDLIKETILDIKVVNSENSIMLKLANEFKAEYDGWGTPVIK